MLNSIKIKNFRCFEDIEVSGFKRINFIVGKNATGKTALLEGIIIGLQGNLDILLKIIGMRGNVKFIKQLDNEIYSSYWGHFFKDENTNLSFSIFTKFDNNSQNKISCFFDKNKYFNISSGDGSGYTYQPFIMKSQKDNEFDVQESALIIQEAGISLGKLAPLFSKSTMVSANYPFDNDALATLYSKYNIAGDEELYLKAMQKLFPEIESFSIEKKSITSIYVKYKGVKTKIPISQVSYGINKVFALIAMIIYNENGIVLIDEIENGLHVSILERFWKVLYELAYENKVQLFITSHSLECMNAAEKTVDKHSEDFALFKMVQEEGKISVNHFSGNILKNVLESDYDFR